MVPLDRPYRGVRVAVEVGEEVVVGVVVELAAELVCSTRVGSLERKSLGSLAGTDWGFFCSAVSFLQ